MLFYLFKSKKFITDFKILDYMKYSPFSERDFLYDRTYLPFSVAILYEYSKFIFKRLFFFIKKKESFKYRAEYYTSLYFKHTLIIEWGLYDLNELYSYSKHSTDFLDDFLPNPYDPSSFRGDYIIEYVVSKYDLISPFHKTTYKRYLFDIILPQRPPSIGYKFFFNFYFLMPTEAAGPVLNLDKFNTFSQFYELPPPPLSVNYPILFELFLLKFNIFSLLFSTHSVNIYNFYNGLFFESIFIRFKNLFYIIFNFYLNRF